MIRFIATDLDGTLLDERGVLPKEIFPLIGRLYERGILFAPASGRQYANLKKLFFPVWEKLLFICENGALVKQGGETVYSNPLPVPLVKVVLDAVRDAEDLFPILCCEENAYVENENEPFFSRAKAPYTRCIKTDNLDEYIFRERVCKISVYDEHGAENHALRLLSRLPDGVKLTLSGAHWCDVSAARADKGEAVKEIQRRFGFSPDECMAFGDHMNDEEMLRACTHSRAVENAVPAIKALAEEIVPRNTDKGVLLALEKLLGDFQKT